MPTKINFPLGLPRAVDVNNPAELKRGLERIIEALQRLNGEHNAADRALLAGEVGASVAPASGVSSGGGGSSVTGVVANNGLLLSGGLISVDRAYQPDMENPTTGNKIPASTAIIYHPGVAKAHCRFAGSTGSIVGTAYNVSSITRHAVGDWTVNLSGSFPPSSVNNTIQLTADHSAAVVMVVDTRSGVTTYRVRCYDLTGTLVDPAHVNFTLHGDL